MIVVSPAQPSHLELPPEVEREITPAARDFFERMTAFGRAGSMNAKLVSRNRWGRSSDISLIDQVSRVTARLFKNDIPELFQ